MPLEARFALGSTDFKEHVGAATTFIERVRKQFPDIIFVLIFGNIGNRDKFLQAAGGRFNHYLILISDAVESELPAILEKCQTWHNRRRESRTSLKQVFVCHSSGDKSAVRELCGRLKGDGIHPWLDEEAILPGQEWQVEITKAVRASDAIIVCLSKASISKEGYVQKEIKYALDVADEKSEGSIFIIPVKLEECTVPSRLIHWQWVNLFDERGYDNLLRALRQPKQKI